MQNHGRALYLARIGGVLRKDCTLKCWTAFQYRPTRFPLKFPPRNGVMSTHRPHQQGLVAPRTEHHFGILWLNVLSAPGNILQLKHDQHSNWLISAKEGLGRKTSIPSLAGNIAKTYPNKRNSNCKRPSDDFSLRAESFLPCWIFVMLYLR